MKRPITVLALAVCAALAGPSSKSRALAAEAVPELSAQEIFKRVSPSVMIVESLDARGNVTAFGSGVVIAPGRVITNRHVIEGGASFEIKHGAVEWPAQLVRVDGDHDLAELSVASLATPSVHVRESSSLVVGEKVYAFGAPEGLELTISEGLISGLRKFDKGQVIQTSAAISPGSSGGGLFDTEGRLVGITTFYLKEGQSLNFALPAQWTLALDSQPVNTGLASNESSRKFQALTWSEVGKKALESHDYKAALRAFKKAVRLNPGDDLAWGGLGTAYSILNDFKNALDAYRELVRLRPDNPYGWSELGGAYADLGEYESALTAQREAIRLMPSDESLWVELGRAYMNVNDFKNALDGFQQALRLKPSDGHIWVELAIAYGNLKMRMRGSAWVQRTAASTNSRRPSRPTVKPFA